MQITFNKDEVAAAVTAHVSASGIPLRGKQVNVVKFGDDGSVEVSIDDAKTATRKTRKTRTPKAAATETAETETAEEEAPASDEAEAVADEMELRRKKLRQPRRSVCLVLPKSSTMLRIIFDYLKAISGSFVIGVFFVFVVIFGYILVPTIMLMLVVGTSFLLILDHYRYSKRGKK